MMLKKLSRREINRVLMARRQSERAALELIVALVDLPIGDVIVDSDETYKIEGVEFCEDGMDIGDGVTVCVVARRRLQSGNWSARTTILKRGLL